MNKKVVIGIVLIAAIGIFVYLKSKPFEPEAEVKNTDEAKPITKEAEKKLEEVKKIEPSAKQKLYEKAYVEAKTAIMNSANYKKLNDAQKFIMDEVLLDRQYDKIKDVQLERGVFGINKTGKKYPFIDLAISESSSKNIPIKKWIINNITNMFYDKSQLEALADKIEAKKDPNNPNSAVSISWKVKTDYFAMNGLDLN